VLVEEAIVDFPGVLCGFGGEARGQAAGRRLPGGLGVPREVKSEVSASG
jgi:hypothetical protein